MANTPDVQRYLRILRLIRAGKSDQLGGSDYKFFSRFSFDVDKTAIARLQNEEEFKNMSEEEISDALENSFLLAAQSPETREEVLSAAQSLEKSELAGKIGSVLNIALASGDIVNSRNQINTGDEAQRQAVRPQRPAPLTADPRLKEALRDASTGDLDAARALSPAQLQILDQYLADMNTAKSVSGGQAGVYGSLAQVASTRRGRRSAELVPLYDDVVRRSEMRYDQLLAQKLNENNSIQQSRAQFYPHDLNQYNNEIVAAGNVSAMGRQNLRSSVGALGSFLPSFVSGMSTRKRFRDLYNQGLAYGPENAAVIAEADKNFRSGYEEDYNNFDETGNHGYN